MAKRKLHHLHKIKIHHNRWLIWAISYTLIVTIALVAYVKISELWLDSEAENVYAPQHSYTDQRLGFALRYPADWSIEAASTSVIFMPTEGDDDGVTVSAVVGGSDIAVRKSLKISAETTVSVGGVTGIKIANDLGMDHTETVILAHHNGKLYIIRGSEVLVQKILPTFHFVTQK